MFSFQLLEIVSISKQFLFSALGSVYYIIGWVREGALLRMVVCSSKRSDVICPSGEWGDREQLVKAREP